MSKRSLEDYKEKVMAQLRKQGPVSSEKREKQALEHLRGSQQKRSSDEEEKALRSIVESHLKALKDILAEAETMFSGEPKPFIVNQISALADRPLEQMVKDCANSRMAILEYNFQHTERVLRGLLKQGPVPYEKRVKQMDAQMKACQHHKENSRRGSEAMEELSKETALKVVAEYLSKEIHEELSFVDETPDSIYSHERPENCYCICVSDHQPHLGSSRMICISKVTGRIVFDGLVGE